MEPRKKLKTSFILLAATLGIPRSFWGAKFLRLFRMVKSDSASGVEFAFVQYIDRTNSFEHLDEIFACVCIGWSTVDEHGHT